MRKPQLESFDAEDVANCCTKSDQIGVMTH